MIRSELKVAVRKAKVSDSEALAKIYAESWRQAYRGIIPHSHLECMIRRRGVQAWRESVRTEGHLLVLEAAGVIAGYATCGAARHGGRHKGEIYEIYLAPHYQGLGLGEYLFEGCRHQLDQRRLNGLIVWALTDNTLAADFYYRRGGRPVARSTERFGKTVLSKTGYGFD